MADSDEKPRNVGGPNPSEVKDRISSLPDVILCSVVSLLPTKEAIRTSALSKQWKYVWNSITHITLDDSPLDSDANHDQSQLDRFMNYVDRVIFRPSAINMVKFCLSFSVPIEESRVNIWISVLKSYGVQELILTLSAQANYDFRFSVFSFDTLTVLHLQSCSLIISTEIRFLNLQTCHLVSVTLLDHRFIPCMFPDCPVLGDLVFENCLWHKPGTLIIDVHSLKKLKVSFNDFYILVKICAPNLEDLELNGCFTWVDSVLCNRDSLVQVSLYYLVTGPQDDDSDKQVIRLLEAIRVVKSFEIPNDPFQKIALLESLELGHDDCIPSFHNLTHLKLFFDDCFPQGVHIMCILLRSPRLETLSIDADRKTDWFWVDDPKANYCAHPDFKPVLKQVSIAGFNGYHGEIRFLKVLLEHSVSLEKLDLLCADSMSKKYKYEVGNYLQKLPRGSSSCVIELTNLR